MVAEKLDPTVGRICFCRIFQTVMNLEKRTTETSSKGPKMVEKKGMGWSEVARKYKNPATHVGGSRCVCRPDPGASGYGWP